MKLSELKKAGVFSTQIDLADGYREAGLADKAEAFEGLYIEMRELSGDEQIRVRGKDDEETGKNIAAMFDACICGHNIPSDEEGKPASKKEVAALVRSSGTLFNYVLNKWGAALPLAKASAQESNSSDEQSSGTGQDAMTSRIW